MKDIKSMFAGGVNHLYNSEYYIKKLNDCLYKGFVPNNIFIGCNDSFLSAKYSDFHQYEFEGNQLFRKTINPCKMLSQYLVRNMYAELPNITVKDNEDMQNKLNQLLVDIGLLESIVDETETMVNLGDMVIKPYIEDSEIKLDFVDALSFFPLREENKKIVDCVFITKKVAMEKKKSYTYTRLEYHYQPYEVENGKLIYLKNKRHVKIEVYKSIDNSRMGDLVNTNREIMNVFGELYQDEVIEYDISCPTFVHIKTPTKNNFNRLSGRGIGQFTNSLDTIKSLDEDYTTMSIEIVYGMLMTYVPDSSLEERMVQTTNSKGETEILLDKQFTPTPYKIKYQSNSMNDDKPTHINPDLRIDKQLLKFNADLDIMSIQSGFSNGTLRYDGKTITTATQVLVDASDTAKTVKSYENNLGNGIVKLINLCNELLVDSKLQSIGEIDNDSITVNWFDNVIVDDSEEIERMKSDSDNYDIPKYIYLMKAYGLSEEEAKDLYRLGQEEKNNDLNGNIDDTEDDDIDNQEDEEDDEE